MPGRNHICVFFRLVVIARCILFSSVLFAYTNREVDEDGLAGDFYYNETADDQRPVIIFGGSGGGYFLDKEERGALVKPLVDKGYAVLFLVYFDYKSKGKLPKSLLRIPLEYFETAMTWVGRQPGVGNDSFAIYGSSRGGELALLLATHYPQIRVVIAGVPSAYVWPTTSGHTIGSYLHPCAPAWTYHGKDINGICSFKMLFSGNKIILKYPEKFDKYVIPVEKMSADVLLLSGTRDEVWPSTEMSKRIIQRLEQFNYSHAYKHIAYDAGHWVFKQSWPDVISFLETHYPANE